MGGEGKGRCGMTRAGRGREGEGRVRRDGTASMSL